MMVLMIMNVVLIDDGIDDYECGINCINAYDDKYDDETETDGLI